MKKLQVLGTILAALTAVVLVLVGMAMGLPTAQAGAGDPAPGTVAGVWTVTMYPATYEAAGGTVYSSSPRYVSGLDVSRARNWHSMDVFVTVDVSGTASVVVTAQYSADATNWTDAEYTSEGWVLPLSNTTTLTNASGVTSTTTSTSTTVFASGTATRVSEQVDYAVTIAADATEFFRMPILGEYVRFKMISTAAAGHGVTVTIKATLRND